VRWDVARTVFLFVVIVLTLWTAPFQGPTGSTSENLDSEHFAAPHAGTGTLAACSLPFVSYAHVSHVAWRAPYLALTRLELWNQTQRVSSGVYTPPPMLPGYRWTWSEAEACGDKPFAFLSSDSWRASGGYGIGGNTFIVDANGSGSSRHFYFYASPLDDVSLAPKATTLFAFTNNTSVTLQLPGTPPSVIWSGNLNRGQRRTEFGFGHQYLEVIASENVSVLDHAVNGFYVPSENGLFSGTHFVTRVRWNGYFESLQVIPYFGDTDVVVSYLASGAVVWQGRIDRAEIVSLPNSPLEFYDIRTTKPVTVASLGAGRYAVQEFVPDAAGTRLGTYFLTPVAPGVGSRMYLFSFFNQTHVDLYNATSGIQAAAYDLNSTEFQSVDASALALGTVRIQSSKPISVQLLNGMTGADAYAPVSLRELPDLAVRSSDVTIFPPNPVVGQSVLIRATVRNAGDARAGAFATRLFEGPPGTAPQIGGDRFPDGPTDPGGWTVPSFVWNPGFAGAGEICVEVDSENYIAEVNETNNGACIPINIVPPPDYTLTNAQPSGFLTVGLERDVTIAAEVSNQGATANVTTTLSFHNASTPGSPFAQASIPAIPGGTAVGPFNATWRSPSTPGQHFVTASLDPDNLIAEADEGNNAFTWTFDVVPGPISTLVVGTPNYNAEAQYVTSATRMSFDVVDQSGAGIRETSYRADGGAWTNYSTSGPFGLRGEGPHTLEFFSEDNVGNVEMVQTSILHLDDTPPTTTLLIGDPNVLSNGTYVTSATPLVLQAVEGGADPAGLAGLEYRVDGGVWWPYSSAFFISGEGPHVVDYRALDLLGNVEPLHADTIIVDNTSPSTTLRFGVPIYVATETFVTSDTPLTLQAVDGGTFAVGVDTTEYRVDGGAWTPYATAFGLAGEGTHVVECRSVDLLGNREAVLLSSAIVDDSPPTTSLSIGSPQHLGPEVFVTSFTPLTMVAADAGATPVGLASTEYRLDGGVWTPYATPFFLDGEGAHLLEYRSVDRLGNVESTGASNPIVDDTPPLVAADLGNPRYEGPSLYIRSLTTFLLEASDGGPTPVGISSIEYRIGTSWTPYSGPFAVSGPDGARTVAYRATDLLGNTATGAIDVVIDDTPPTTTPSHEDGTYPPGTAFAFHATDAGSGVARTEVRIDGDTSWTMYTAPLALAEGVHTISFRSVDRLNIAEAEDTLSVTIEGAPPPATETNWKPLVAAAFSTILAVVGFYSARRVPARGTSRPRVCAFLLMALPFIALEMATGILSFHTGWLSIPPVVGLGSAVDLGILVAGTAVLSYRVVKGPPPK